MQEVSGSIPLSSTNCRMSPSSRGLGHCPFTAITGVRIPLGTISFQHCRGIYEKDINHCGACWSIDYRCVFSRRAGSRDRARLFSGFVGPTGAFHMAAFQGSSSVDSDNGVFTNFTIGSPPFPQVTISQLVFPAGNILSNGADGNVFSGYYGVQGGVGKVFNHRWYIGVVGFGEWGSQTDSGSTSITNFGEVLVLRLAEVHLFHSPSRELMFLQHKLG